MRVNSFRIAYLLAFCTITLVISSCATQKRCNRRFPPETSIEIKDSIIEKTKIEYHDTIIEVLLPFDTAAFFKTLKPINNVVNLDTLTRESGIVGAQAWVNNNRMGVRGYIADSTLFYALDSARKEVHTWKEKYNTQKQTIVRRVKYVPMFYKLTAGFSILVLVNLLIYIIIRFWLPGFGRK